MTLNQSLVTLDYTHIVDYVLSESDKSKMKQLKIFYREFEKKYPRCVINAAVLLALRITKGKLPANRYIKSTLESWFKNAKNEDDAAQILKDRLQNEIDKQDIARETKKAYQNKISMTQASANYIGKDPARRIKQLTEELQKESKQQRN